MIRTFSTVVGRRVSRDISSHITSDGRVSLQKHLLKRDDTIHPLRTNEGRSALVKISFMVAGVSLLGSALVYTAFMHPDVQLDKIERQKPIRENAKKARRFASHRKLAAHQHT